MEISQLKTGCKFQLTEDFTVESGRIKTWPSGLVFSLVSLTLNANGARVFLKVIRCLPVIKKYYTGIAQETYIAKNYGSPYIAKNYGSPRRSFINLRLSGNDARNFLDMIGTARLINFNREYENLTKCFKAII